MKMKNLELNLKNIFQFLIPYQYFFAEKNNFELAHSYNDHHKELLNLLNNKKFSYDTEYYDKKMVFYNYNKARFFQFERKLEEAEKYFFNHYLMEKN